MTRAEKTVPDSLGEPVAKGDIVTYVKSRATNLRFGQVIGFTKSGGVRLVNFTTGVNPKAYNRLFATPEPEVVCATPGQFLLIRNSENYQGATSSMLAEIFPNNF
jgi:hypothetical protein